MNTILLLDIIFDANSGRRHIEFDFPVGNSNMKWRSICNLSDETLKIRLLRTNGTLHKAIECFCFP